MVALEEAYRELGVGVAGAPILRVDLKRRL